jgi:hypothetical protein
MASFPGAAAVLRRQAGAGTLVPDKQGGTFENLRSIAFRPQVARCCCGGALAALQFEAGEIIDWLVRREQHHRHHLWRGQLSHRSLVVGDLHRCFNRHDSKQATPGRPRCAG